QEKIPGVEVLFADRKRSVEMVCGEGSEMRALILEKRADNWRNTEQPKPEWHALSLGVPGGVPGAVTEPPQACRAAEDPLATLKENRFLSLTPLEVSHQSSVWMFNKRETDAGGREDSHDAERSNLIFNPVITPDRKWLVAVTHTPEYSSIGPQL